MEIKIPVELPDDWYDKVAEKLIEKGDYVLVTRCKDCVNSRPLCHAEKNLYNDGCVGCVKISTSYHSVIMNENDFCSFAEQKEIEGE